MKTSILTTSLIALGSLTAASEAGSILYNSIPQSTNNAVQNVDGVDVTVTGGAGNFKQKTNGGFTGLGIAGGNVDAEIDNAEFLTFTFSAPVHITKLSVVHLYKSGQYGDQWDEVAKFVTSMGTFQLEAEHSTTGNWDGLGTLTNLSPATEGNGGAWQIAGEDIFGGPITSLTLMSGNPGGLAKFGDFGFKKLEFIAASVPAPGAFAALGLAGLFGGRRRK